MTQFVCLFTYSKYGRSHYAILLTLVPRCHGGRYSAVRNRLVQSPISGRQRGISVKYID